MLAYLAILACAISGFAGAPAWSFVAGAVALASLSYAEHGNHYERASGAGLNRLVNITLLRSFLTSLVAAAVAFTGGWALKGL